MTTEKEKVMPTITLIYTLEDLNALLSLLGQLPFVQSAPAINNIHQQASPQIKQEEIKES